VIGSTQPLGSSATIGGHLHVVESLDDLREDWIALAPQSENIFSTWEWASTWWRHYGNGAKPLVVGCSEPRGGDIVALLPLYVWSVRPVRIARFIGHGPADQLGPVCAPAARAVAADALRAAAARSKLDLVLAELLPGDGGWPALLRRKPMLVEASPAISLADGWQAYLARRSRNLRQQIHRRERQLHHRHSVRFRLVVEPDRLDEDLTQLFELHTARWGQQSAFLRFESFHREFAAVALDRGWLRLWLLELDERPAAAWYGFRFAGVESYYQAGRDLSLAEESVGFVLLAHTIRAAAEDGMKEYRLLRGAESFKFRFAETNPELYSFALASGIAGRAAQAAATVGIRSATARTALRRIRSSRGSG
jgi:CelD/BcsL family acetyltransferase involved in cellulose biosynthesis